MVRPGIMIYGFRPDPETPATIPLKPGMSLLTRVSFVKQVARGTSIGYGRTWVAPADTFIATIPAGYADGFNRLFSNRGRVLIGGRSYPLVGRVCMDQSMVDLGPETDVRSRRRGRPDGPERRRWRSAARSGPRSSAPSPTRSPAR